MLMVTSDGYTFLQELKRMLFINKPIVMVAILLYFRQDEFPIEVDPVT